jgi:hypothetical protein
MLHVARKWERAAAAADALVTEAIRKEEAAKAQPAPAPKIWTNEQFEARVYELIIEKTGMDYRWNFEYFLTPEEVESIHQWIVGLHRPEGGAENQEDAADCVANIIIKTYEKSCKAHRAQGKEAKSFVERLWELA